MPSSSYSEDELKLLRYTPMSPHLDPRCGPTYNHSASVINSNSSDSIVSQNVSSTAKCHNTKPIILFANYDKRSTKPQFVVPTPSLDDPVAVKWRHSPHAFRAFRHDSSLAQWTRYGRTIACFNLYPAKEHDLQINHLIWNAAQRGEYCPSDGNLLLHNNILSLSMPREFFHFLRSVSEEELKQSMLEVLALIAEDEDAEGLSLMKSELEPSIWEDLTLYIRACETPSCRMDVRSKEGRKLMTAVESLLRFCYLSPWKIDIYASYISPMELNGMLQCMEKNMNVFENDLDSMQYSRDRRLVRSHARRPVSSSCPTSHYFVSSRSNFLTVRNCIFWKMFQDWRRYRMVLVQFLGLSPSDAVQIMVDSISRGTQDRAWERAETVLACSMVDGNLFSQLPKEVVFSTIAPYVLYFSSIS
ncbi:hypothetical protein BWQ96_04750 [Gracilariopsis chorda]|uniref:Uncharacterized protein n=1 Tax=Gracilariopsis chorda TaxID=448386 RepID=A0A2V3ITM6_9FLOR|nr:hypothetical protein BWQ96_04750 [Gracilariopsis chorda]|eukprot:PXF45452.1 hypothetical protein BWQ96_04750 [Gracilariopsis chorda]